MMDTTEDLEVCRLHRHLHLRVLVLTFALVKLRLGVVCVKLGEGEEGIRTNADFLLRLEKVLMSSFKLELSQPSP